MPLPIQNVIAMKTEIRCIAQMTLDVKSEIKMRDDSPKFLLVGLVALAAYLYFTGSFRQYKWAFAENRDGTIHEREECRETLADLIYQIDMKSVGPENKFFADGISDPYYIHAFKKREECDTALTNMVLRRKR